MVARWGTPSMLLKYWRTTCSQRWHVHGTQTKKNLIKQAECECQGLEGKFIISTDFGRAWVCIRGSALGWSPMASRSMCQGHVN